MQTQINNNNEIHCKVQFGNEFRRFFLQHSYSAMLDQIRTIFNFKNDDDLCIKYSDDEGDLVTVSSDEELAFAIELFSNSVLRLTVAGPVLENNKKCAQRFGPKWAPKENNESDKWEKLRAEKAELWKQKKAQKVAAKLESKKDGKSKSEKWEAKRACWEAKKEKFLNDPELCKKKLENIEMKLQKLQDRKQWLQTKVDENVNPGFANRLAHINAKINRFESFRAMLTNPGISTGPVVSSVVPVVSVPEPNPVPAPFNLNVTEADLNVAKEDRAIFVNEITETQLKIQAKKNELQALRVQARSSEITREVANERTNTMRKELEDLRTAWQEKKSALHSHDAKIRTIRQALQSQKKAQKQQAH